MVIEAKSPRHKLLLTTKNRQNNSVMINNFRRNSRQMRRPEFTRKFSYKFKMLIESENK